MGKKKTKENKILFIIFMIALMFLINSEFIALNNFNPQRNEQMDYNNDKIFDKEIDKLEDYEENFNYSSIHSSGFQDIAASNVTQFDVLEEAQSTIETNGYNVSDSANNFTIGLPNEWNISNYAIDIQSVYHREEILRDNEFKTGDSNNWDFDKKENGIGGFGNDWTNEEIKTEVYGLGGLSPGEFYFIKEDYAHWYQLSTGLNPDGIDVQIGDKIQNSDELYPIDDDFIVDPEYGQDFNNPYGGARGDWDITELGFIPGELKCRIDPSDTPLWRGNPSIAWWTPFEIPFEAD